jgi:hypothetical protein
MGSPGDTERLESVRDLGMRATRAYLSEVENGVCGWTLVRFPERMV